MHPVMSELGLYVAEHEAWARREAAGKQRLVREAAGHAPARHLASRFVAVVRQFVDPRGYALAQVGTPDRATPPPVVVPTTPVIAIATVTTLEISQPALASRPRQAA